MKKLATLSEVLAYDGLPASQHAGLILLVDQFVKGFQDAGVLIDLSQDTAEQAFGGHFYVLETADDVSLMVAETHHHSVAELMPDAADFLDFDDETAMFMCFITNTDGGNTYIIPSSVSTKALQNVVTTFKAQLAQS